MNQPVSSSTPTSQAEWQALATSLTLEGRAYLNGAYQWAASGETFFASDAELRNELNTRAWEDTWPRFATRPAAVDHGRYDRFEAFMQESGVVETVIPAADLVVDVTAQAKP